MANDLQVQEVGQHPVREVENGADVRAIIAVAGYQRAVGVFQNHDEPTLRVAAALLCPEADVHWNGILRLATSIRQGMVTASLMLSKFGSYPRRNGLAVTLRELGRIERTLFSLDWFQSVELWRRVNAGLNKGEARNALARAVFFYRLSELRDRNIEQQRYRASDPDLATAANH